jgi:16S rRNA processing protein RimM
MSEPGANALTVGKITGPYGVKGWVKIHSFTDPEENLFRFGAWQLERRGSLETVEFDEWKRHGKGMVAHIAGVDDRTLAESFKGLQIVVEANSLPSLEEGDFYWHQLQGLQVWGREPRSTTDEPERDRVLLGTVDYLIETGANDVLVVKASENSIDDRERLIPYLPGDVVSRVSLEQGVVEVEWYLEE